MEQFVIETIEDAEAGQSTCEFEATLDQSEAVFRKIKKEGRL